MSIKDLFKEKFIKFKASSDNLTKSLNEIKKQLEQIATKQSDLQRERAEVSSQKLNPEDTYNRIKLMINRASDKYIEKNQGYIASITNPAPQNENDLLTTLNKFTNDGKCDNGFLFWALKEPLLNNLKLLSNEFADETSRSLSERNHMLNNIDADLAELEEEEGVVTKILNDSDLLHVTEEYKEIS